MKEELEDNLFDMARQIRTQLNNDFPGNTYVIVINNDGRVRHSGNNFINIYTDNTRSAQVAHFTSHKGSASNDPSLSGSSIHFKGSGGSGRQIILNLIGTYPRYTGATWDIPIGTTLSPVEQSITNAIMIEIQRILYECGIYEFLS